MKTIYNYLFLFLLIPIASFANDGHNYKFSKEKTIQKAYNVNADAEFQVSNSFGNVNIYLSDENKISIQINIKVSSNDESQVIDKLNSIDVNFSASQSVVNAKTVFGNTNWRSGSNMSYEVNYIVKIPRNASIDLINKYGNITVEKLNGASKLKCQYGSIVLGQFNNKSNTIDISYSSHSTIDFIDNLNLRSQYSDVVFQKANQINIQGNYNDFKFQNIGGLNIDSSYSKVNANSIQRLNCEGNYLTLKLGEIGQSANIQSNYSGVQMSANNKVKNISINGSYTNSKILCSPDFDFDFNIDLRYGSLKYDMGLKFTEKSEKGSSKTYSGYNISSGKSKIAVSSSYGSIQLLNK